MLNLIRKISTPRFANAAMVSSLEELSEIHRKQKNIAICEREVADISNEAKSLLDLNFQLKCTGSKPEILEALSARLEEQSCKAPLLGADIDGLLSIFQKIASADSMRFGLFVVQSDMCSRFHSDVNDLRMLCTYSGQGTLWLPNEAVNHRAHWSGKDNDEIVAKPKLIQRANAGDVLILKGALYPEAEAVIHRSPGIGDTNEKRLLLRVDTNQFANFF